MLLALPCAENRVEFLEKLQRVCGQIPAGNVVQPVLSSPSPARLAVGNWSLTCQREGEVSIHNADGTRVRALSPVARSLVYISSIPVRES